MGRQKIKIERVKDPNTLQVTFSKRRGGLFKKANELSILCGIEIAIVVFSPGNKPYSFAHPTVEAVSTKFLKEPKLNEARCSSSHEAANLGELKEKLVQVTNQLNEDKKQGFAYDEALKQHKVTELHEHKNLRDLFHHLICNVKGRLDEMEVAATMLILAEKPIEGTKNRAGKRKRKI